MATAIAFSPNMAANICESVRLKDMLGEKLLLIHVGDRTEEAESDIVKILASCGSEPGGVEVIWETGDPASAILKVAEEQSVDLIIAGAEPREGLLRYYMGSVARRLVRKSNCSILLLTAPDREERICRRIVVNGLNHPKTPDTIKVAISVGENIRCSELVIVEEVEPRKIGTKVEDDKSLQKASEARARIEEVEDSRINGILDKIDVEGDLNILRKCIFGKKGYTIGHFAETTHADLLVMNSPDTKLGFMDRVFTHDLEYILSELPCDLLIVHSKRN